MMTELETLELALRRARSAELAERMQDPSTIHVLDRIIAELERIATDRADEPTGKR